MNSLSNSLNLDNNLTRFVKSIFTDTHYVAMFLKFKHNFLFLTDNENDYYPVLIPLKLMGMAEEDLQAIKAYMLSKYDLGNLDISLSHEVLSLNPVCDVTIYGALVSLNLIQFQKLKDFELLTKGDILLMQESNFFFGFLHKCFDLTKPEPVSN